MSIRLLSWRSICAAVILMSLPAQAQPMAPGGPVQLWSQQFGTAEDDRMLGMSEDGAGGLFLVGSTDGDLGGGGPAGFKDPWIARVDGNGDRLWIRQFGSANSAQEFTDVTPDGAGGALVSGGVISGAPQPPHPSLSRFTGNGDLLWVRSDSWGKADVVASDGAQGAFIAGNDRRPGSTNIHCWIVRYDADGNRLWGQQNVTRFGNGWVYDALPDGAGGVFLCGRTGVQRTGEAWLARYDGNGNELWLDKFALFFFSLNSAGKLAPDGSGGVLVKGGASQLLGGSTSWLVRYDASGNRLWEKDVGDLGGLSVDSSGDLFMVRSPGLETQLVRTDPAVNIRWVYALPTTPGVELIGTRMVGAGAGGVFMGGYTHFGPNEDIWLTRFAESDCYVDCNVNSVLDIFDFLCFQDAFAEGLLHADCDGNSELDIMDFLCFQDAFVRGCS